MATVLLPLAALTLDRQNPRHEPTRSTRETILALLDTEGHKMVSLAEDIATYGTSPAELPIVFKDGDGIWVVAEGNRRIATLKLLADPGLAKGHALAARFTQIATNSQVPNEIECAVVLTRDEARHWVELRHTGERRGAGIVPWTAEMKDRFDRRPGSQVARALAFIQAVQKAHAKDKRLMNDTEAVRVQRVTTLGRLVGGPYFRKKLRFHFADADSVVFDEGYDHSKALRRLFADLAGDVGVTQLKSRQQREAYSDILEADLAPTANRQATSSTPVSQIPPQREPAQPVSTSPRPDSTGASHATGVASHSETPDRTSTGSTKPQEPLNRRQRVRPHSRLFQGVVLRNLDLRVSDVLKESQSLDIEGYPNIAYVMLREVVDLVTSDALRRLNMDVETSDIKSRMRSCLTYIDPKRGDDDLVEVWAAVNATEHATITSPTLHTEIVDVAKVPVPESEIKRMSIVYSYFVSRVDGAVGSDRR